MTPPHTPSAVPRTQQRRDVPLASPVSRLALVYLLIHAAFAFLARRHIPIPTFVFVVDGLLAAALVALNTVRVPWPIAKRTYTQVARLWAPVVFFWFAYRWSFWTLYAFHPPEFSYDGLVIALDGALFGQASLWLAHGGHRWLTELFQLMYMSYFLYLPFLGIYLSWRRRFGAFEQLAFAVLLGYFVSYPLFAITPVWSPRWAFVDSGVLDLGEARLAGYWVTDFMNRLMWDGAALKGGAFPSSHSSTATIFCAWCWKLWGRRGGIPATIVVTGMWVGAVYGRYHYVVDILAGIVLGLVSMWAAGRLRHETVREAVDSSA